MNAFPLAEVIRNFYAPPYDKTSISRVSLSIDNKDNQINIMSISCLCYI